MDPIESHHAALVRGMMETGAPRRSEATMETVVVWILASLFYWWGLL
ncbi:hypothetical protein AB0H00_20695 [Nocardia sp. NPDC023852]|nr:hypothetical protein OH799_26005 [Nocardia sp. NBC_00881]